MNSNPLDVFDTIELILDANGGQISGRTAIQKLVYLSKSIMPELDIPSYKPHYYGPFSPGVSMALEKLVSYSFVSENRVPASQFESYVYNLTADGKKIVKPVKKKHAVASKRISGIVKICKEFCELRPTPLSYASKVYFTLEDLPKVQRREELENAVEKAKLLGWDISPHDVEVGKQLLQKLALV
ncbi:MAG: hypothetical protein ABI361_03360 [Nitrososphaera sp.]|jgi:uncharacterized protein YwgA